MIEISKKKKKKKKNYKMSFCITCMGRKVHLEQTLLKNIRVGMPYRNVEFVLLDYNSPDGLEKWIYNNFRDFISIGVLKYCKTTEPSRFRMSHAKNVAHRMATGDILCNLDADNFVHKGFIDQANRVFRKNNRIVFCVVDDILGKRKDLVGGAKGRIAIKREDFYRINGYNEICAVWGNDDTDFVKRLVMSGCRKEPIDIAFMSSIYHDDKVRFKNYDVKNGCRSVVNKFTKKKFSNYVRKNGFVANLDNSWGNANLVVNFKEKISI